MENVLDPIENEKHGWVPVGDISKLKRGDIVKSKSHWQTYVVEANYGDRVTAVTSKDITNEGEWEVFSTFHQKS